MSLDNVPSGFHVAVVDRVEFFRSANKGTPGLKVMFTLDAYPESASCDIWLSEKAIGMARAALRKLGYNPDTGSLKELANTPTLLRGNKFEVEIFEDEYQGKFRMKAEIPRNAPFKAAELDALDATLKGAAADLGTPEGEEPDPSAWEPRKEPDLGDIPFALLLAVGMSVVGLLA